MILWVGWQWQAQESSIHNLRLFQGIFLLFNLASYDPPSEIFLVPCPTMTNKSAPPRCWRWWWWCWKWGLRRRWWGSAANADDDATPETRQRKLMFLPSSSATEVSTVVCCLTSPWSSSCSRWSSSASLVCQPQSWESPGLLREQLAHHDWRHRRRTSELPLTNALHRPVLVTHIGHDDDDENNDDDEEEEEYGDCWWWSIWCWCAGPWKYITLQKWLFLQVSHKQWALFASVSAAGWFCSWVISP